MPVKAVDEYLPRLLRSGRRVAICEQVEDAAEADGLVRREVVETITPGTVLEDGLLTADRNNFIVVLAGRDPVGVATADLSTGEFELWSVRADEVADQLARLEPAELVVAEGDEGGAPSGPWTVSRLAPWRFEPAMADEALRDQFGVAGTEGFGFRAAEEPHLVSAAGALVAYLREVRPAGVEHLRPPRVERAGRYMHLDEMTRRNLELVSPLRAEGGGTLLEVLDRTRTAMGGRLLRRRVLHPLLDLDGIHYRQAGVAELVEAEDRRRALRSALADYATWSAWPPRSRPLVRLRGSSSPWSAPWTSSRRWRPASRARLRPFCATWPPASIPSTTWRTPSAAPSIRRRRRPSRTAG